MNLERITYPGIWIGFDLDGTLATDGHDGIIETLGDPVPAMIDLLKGFLDSGITVKIVTARVAPSLDPEKTVEQIQMITEWLVLHVGPEASIIPIQAWKDPNMLCIYEDRAIAVERSTGKLMAWPKTFPYPDDPTLRDLDAV